MSSYGVKSPTDPIPAGEGEVQQQNVCLMLNAQPNLSLIDGCELPSWNYQICASTYDKYKPQCSMLLVHLPTFTPNNDHGAYGI